MIIKEIMESGRVTLSITEAAHLIGCDPRTLKKDINAEKYPSLSVGSRARIPIAPLLKQLGITLEGNLRGEYAKPAGVRFDIQGDEGKPRDVSVATHRAVRRFPTRRTDKENFSLGLHRQGGSRKEPCPGT
jgi:hypothetical protein